MTLSPEDQNDEKNKDEVELSDDKIATVLDTALAASDSGSQENSRAEAVSENELLEKLLHVTSNHYYCSVIGEGIVLVLG